MKAIVSCARRAVGWLQAGAPLVDVAIRGSVANVFFRSGLLKIDNWDGTLYLFANEYRAPLLSPGLAAWPGTSANFSSHRCSRSGSRGALPHYRCRS